MTIQITRSGNIIQLDEHLDRLRRLVADIETLKTGRHPDPSAIEGSAFIHEWRLDSRPAPCLRGYFEGHPKIRSGRMGATSELWVWAPDHGFARTLSRWYKLGSRAREADGSTRR